MFAKFFLIPKPLYFFLCLILLAAGIYFFYQENTAEQFPIVEYKVTQPSKRAASPPEDTQEASTYSELSSPPDVQRQAESEELLPDAPSLFQDSEVPQFPATVPEQEADTFLPEVEEVELAEDSSQDEDISSVLDQLEIELTEKYPEFVAFANMSLEEIQEVLSIPGERERIGAMAQEAQALYFSEIRDHLVGVPPDTLEAQIEEARDYLTRSWGGELTDALIIQLRQDFGL